jgi:hypothetical protein
MKGKILIPLLKKPPQLLFNLISNEDPRSKHFKEKIRYYNSMFAFTSMGAKIENEINNGSGPSQFIISGQNYHRMGSLIPPMGQLPKYAQLYIYNTENELANRMRNFRYEVNNSSFNCIMI